MAKLWFIFGFLLFRYKNKVFPLFQLVWKSATNAVFLSLSLNFIRTYIAFRWLNAGKMRYKTNIRIQCKRTNEVRQLKMSAHGQNVRICIACACDTDNLWFLIDINIYTTHIVSMIVWCSQILSMLRLKTNRELKDNWKVSHSF